MVVVPTLSNRYFLFIVICHFDVPTSFFLNLSSFAGKSGEITDSEHRTKAAIDRVADLWCYRCDTMVDGEKCMDLSDNSSLFHNKCTDQQRICQVSNI